MPFLLVNTSTKSSTKAKRERLLTRTRVLYLADRTLRLMPARPVLVATEWLEKHRAEVLRYQEQGLLSVRSQDNIPFLLTADNDLTPPEAPRRYPPGFRKEFEEVPEFFLGKGLFDPSTPDQSKVTWEAAKGWQRQHPMELAQERVRPPKVHETPDLAFPKALLEKDEESAPEEPPPAPPPPAVTEEKVEDLVPEVNLPSFVAGLPEDMLLPEDLAGAVDEEPMYSGSEEVTERQIPPMPAAPQVPAPQPVESRGKNRRRR